MELPTWDALACGWSRTIGHRFQSNLCSINVVVCSNILYLLYTAHSFLNSAWGFFVALLIFSFQNTSRRIWITVGIAAGIVTILILWCIYNTWDREEEKEEPVDWPYEPELQVENGTQA